MLSVSVFSVFREYVGILLFICLPLILLSVGLAVWVHYRQKKRKAQADISESNKETPQISIIDLPTQLVTNSPLATEDKFNLIKECRKQLAKSRAKFFALKHDFTTTQNNLFKSESTQTVTQNYNSHMENLLHEKVAVYEKQIADLQSKLEVLETVFPAQDETYFLRQALRERDIEIEKLKLMLAEKEIHNEPVNATLQVAS